MAEPRFDPVSFYEFDMNAGEVRARGGRRVLLLSESVLSPLVTAAVKQGDLTSLRRLGKHLGEHAMSSLGEDPAKLAPTAVLAHVAGVLSIFGWGRLELERHGAALVARLSKLPSLDDDHLGVAALLGGTLSSLVGRETACVPVGDGGFLVVDPGIAERIWEWSKAGDPLNVILARLTSRGNS
jgi:hypothetical protein